MINLSSLNEMQMKAVKESDGPLIILAGAGSGKTKTLATKVAYTLERYELSPHEILALTFSNKAAKEMRERISVQTGLPEGYLVVTTFHSFCARILRSEYRYLGLSSNFTIYDDQESLSIIKSILTARGLSPKETSPYAIQNYIDNLKNLGIYPDRKDFIWKEVQDSFLLLKEDPFFSIYLDYENEIHKTNSLDFGGLITGVLKLFFEHQSLLEKYQDRFKYIFVDEYQDTNRAQFELLHLIAKRHRNLCVVGDEDQSIYSWRGADIRNILDFNLAFPNSKMIKLEQNYRSTQTIINASSSVIAHNRNRSGKMLWTENGAGEVIEIHECETEKAEGTFLCAELLRLKKEKYLLSEMAIFYRNNAQSRPIEDELRKNNIQYRVVGGIKFYDRKEIKDILSYIRLVVNPKDSLALGRVINMPPRGVGSVSLKKIEDYAIEHDLSLWDVISQLTEDQIDPGVRLTGKSSNALKLFVSSVKTMIELESKQTSPSTIIEIILKDLGLMQFYQGMGKDQESVSRVENIQEFVSAIKQYEKDTASPTLMNFIESVTLDKTEKGAEEGQVSLMTIHSAKGLEFKVVFLCGVEENLFPSYKSIESGNELSLEEERRLFYVAMTRAMKKLYISYAQTRMHYGNIRFNGPSRFLSEIPKESVVWHKQKKSYNSWNSNEYFERDGDWNQEVQSSYDSSFLQDKSRKGGFKNSEHKYPVGSVVFHNLYGEGKVREVVDHGDAEKIVVLFSDGTKKKLMVKYAPIRHIEYD